jgi:hypothetical protein
MSQDNPLYSKYLTRPVVRQRNSVTLTKWSAYEVAVAIPATPDDAWIRLRIVAENVPLQLDFMTTQTLGYFLQDPALQSNLKLWISDDNTTDEELTLSDSNDAIVSGFMQRYADTTVSPQQVTAWRDKYGYPAP